MRTRKLKIGDRVFTREDYLKYCQSLNLTDIEARQLTNLAFGNDRKKLRNWRSRQVIGKAVAHKRLLTNHSRPNHQAPTRTK